MFYDWYSERAKENIKKSKTMYYFYRIKGFKTLGYIEDEKHSYSKRFNNYFMKFIVNKYKG